MIEIGIKYSKDTIVTDEMTAEHIRSGDLPVLATPAMLAMMENSAMLSVKDRLSDGYTTVGGHISSSHLKPSKVGDIIRAEAKVKSVDGVKIEFDVAAYRGDVLIGEGTHLRFIVNKEKFMKKLLSSDV